jgi:hypothetical protein
MTWLSLHAVVAMVKTVKSLPHVRRTIANSVTATGFRRVQENRVAPTCAAET